jgi:hypothetical protein
MTKNYKKEARPFAGEHKIGFFEIITFGIFFVFFVWGVYHFVSWLWGFVFLAS